MTGQYAGSVMREDGPMGSREFVMYDSPNGEQVKVYGNWNEYASGRDEEGRDMIADEDYPIIQNEAGEFVLDEVRHNENMDTAYERQPVERMARETEMESTQGASKIENLLEKLQDARGPRPRFDEGGAMPDDKVAKMKKQIVRMMEGGASDKEIMMMINKSPLGKQYEFNWDNVEMKVEAYPLEDGRFEEGGKLPDAVKKMESKIVYMLERGASDKEISKMGRESGLGKDYAFNWDNVEMRVTSFKKKDHSQFNDDFGPRDEGGQRGDMFAYGGMLKRMKEMRYGGKMYPGGGKLTAKGPKTAGPFQGPFGSHGSSATEDLLERLQDYKRRR